MKILVTGAAGFIGFHAAKRLLDDGHQVVGLDNLNDYYEVSLKQDRLALLMHWAPTRSCAVTPTVQPLRAAWPTIWSVVCMSLGRLMRGIASIAATVSNNFIPMGVVLSRSMRFRSLTSSDQSEMSISVAMMSS